jgi:Ca2+-binding EF-hand superfamily protein
MSTATKYLIPSLSKLSPLEADSIKSMFVMYDFRANGKITCRSAVQLLKALGLGMCARQVPDQDMTLKEFLTFVDHQLPDPDPPLANGMFSFVNLVATKHGENAVQPMISSSDIAAFYESIGRPPPSSLLTDLLLTSMQDYDDCESPLVRMDVFDNDVSAFSRRHNLMKDLR